MQQLGVKVRNLFLFETGTYNQQYRRPYETVLTKQVLDAIHERLDNATSYKATQMGGIANQFVVPTAAPEKEIVIPNGWGERRLRFLLDCEVWYPMGGMIRQIVNGYTTHVGVSVSGAVDPQMVFHINSTLQLRETNEQTVFGMQTYSSVVDASQILVNGAWSGIYSPEVDHRLRPEDVYSAMTRTHLQGLKNGKVYDARSVSRNMAVKSRYDNGTAASYMATLLEGQRQASIESNAHNSNDVDVLESARGLVREGLVATDPVLKALAAQQSSQSASTFTFNDLVTLDPNTEAVTTHQFLLPTQRGRVHQAGQTAYWHEATLETQIATILSQAVPSLLMSLGLTGIEFLASNHDFTGQTTVQMVDWRSFSGADMSPQLEVFRTRLESMILADVMQAGQIQYNLHMKVDLMNDTCITLALNGQAPADYVTPSYCDALLTPVLTNNYERADAIAGDFNTLSEELAIARQDRAMHPSILSSGGTAFGNI